MIKKIGLTQRTTYIDQYAERRDSLDQRWWPLIQALGYFPVPLAHLPANDVKDYAQALDLSGIIFTGGEATPERDVFEYALMDFARKEQLPIVGVCRGMQMINQYFGGTITPIQEHVGVRHRIEFCNGWQHFNSRTVNSYHEFGIFAENLAKDLQISAQHADGSIEAFVHSQQKIAAIMWHPEQENPSLTADIELLKGLLS